MKLIFAVLDVSLTMGLTHCYKTEGFTINRFYIDTESDFKVELESPMKRQMSSMSDGVW